MNSWRLAIAASSLVLGSAFAQQADAPKPSLYERIGGLRGITALVDEVVEKAERDKTLGKNPAIAAGRKASPRPYLKFQVSTLICEGTGGPCKYTGRSLKEAHAHLNISEKEWGILSRIFQDALNKFKVGPAEQDELKAMIDKAKVDVVSRP